MSRKYFVKTSLLVIMILNVDSIFAQIPPPPIDTPIDGGVVSLLAAGLVYAVKKIRDLNKR